MRKREQEAYLYVQGRYVYDAVSIALANGFRGKGKPPVEWIDEPYRLMPLTAEEQAEKAVHEREKAIAYFKAMMPPTKSSNEEVE